MTLKVNSLNPFDRNFFGKTIASLARDQKVRGEFLNSSVLKHDSIDDLNQFFVKKSIQSLEKMPVADTLEKAAEPSQIPTMMK